MEQSFLKWAKAQDFAELVRGEKSTLVIVSGLCNCSEAMKQWRESSESADGKLLGIGFSDYKLGISIKD